MIGRPLDLRTRLLALQVVVFGLLLLVSPLTYLLMSRSLHRERDAYLAAMARVTVEDWVRRADTPRLPAGAGLRPCLPDPVPPDADAPGATHRPRHLLVWDGAAVLCSDGEQGPLAPAQALQALRSGEPVFADVRWSSEVLRLVAWPLQDCDGRRVVAEVGTSFLVIEDVLRRGLVLTVVIEAATLVFLIAASWFLTRRAYAPIDRIIARVEAIDQENLAERLQTVAADDQVGRLVTVINRMLERLQRAFDAQSRFSSDVAHEIRSPLTALRGQIEVALRRERSADEYRGVLRESLEEVLRLTRIAEDLMSLARGEAGTLQLQRERVDLREVLREVLARCRGGAVDKDVALVLRASEALWAEADREMLTRLFENLVENAITHSPRTEQVLVGLERRGERAVVSVADRGRGIPAEHLPRIFDRFYRVDPARSRSAGGTGLGLSIVRQIAELHGGAVTVDSTVGQGSVFTVTLPLLPAVPVG